MSWDLILQALETLAVIIGVVFGLVQLRQLRVQREVQAGIELLRPLQAPQAAEALMLIHGLPDGLTEAQLTRSLGKNFGAVMGVLALFESLGPLVARGHVPIEMYADSYRGVTVLCWQKLRPYIEERRQNGWPNLFEWLQWLAERMEQRTPRAGDVPAFDRFRTWVRGSDYERLSA
ncbi:hypothetical protein GCM10022276_28850 [Sphingomonas limnosediminicola]|uniref:DUF4760 domain-containing protein n=1 Tax=Sphingomonas limnosediminicola TaxID=940133 RepID=A0ABP7LYY0_9SPHN